MKFLIVEDEIKTASSLKRGFDEAGFVVSVARDGLDAKLQLESASFDLVVLDILLPEMDGWEVLLWLCEARLQMPVLLLTARYAVADRVRGLELGADDYLVKPFAFSELLARQAGKARIAACALNDLLLALLNERCIRLIPDLLLRLPGARGLLYAIVFATSQIGFFPR